MLDEHTSCRSYIRRWLLELGRERPIRTLRVLTLGRLIGGRIVDDFPRDFPGRGFFGDDFFPRRVLGAGRLRHDVRSARRLPRRDGQHALIEADGEEPLLLLIGEIDQIAELDRKSVV